MGSRNAGAGAFIGVRSPSVCGMRRGCSTESIESPLTGPTPIHLDRAILARAGGQGGFPEDRPALALCLHEFYFTGKRTASPQSRPQVLEFFRNHWRIRPKLFF